MIYQQPYMLTRFEESASSTPSAAVYKPFGSGACFNQAVLSHQADMDARLTEGPSGLQVTHRLTAQVDHPRSY